VLDDIMYVVCAKSSIILLFDKDTYRPLDVVIKVEGINKPWDMVVCDRQLYIADGGLFFISIWRVSVDDHSYVKWLPTESTTHTFHVTRLSVTSRRLLVTTGDLLRQYSTTDGQLLRVVKLPRYVLQLYHGVETTRGTFVIGHGPGTSQGDWLQDAVSELFRFCHVVVIFITIMHFNNNNNNNNNNHRTRLPPFPYYPSIHPSIITHKQHI